MATVAKVVALLDSAAAPVLTLDAGDFWAATGDADRARMDVLKLLPGLRKYVLETGEHLCCTPHYLSQQEKTKKERI